MYKQPHSVDSTDLRLADEDTLLKSPEKWKHIEAKYLKYISLLKSKAQKEKKKINLNYKYLRLALTIKYILQTNIRRSFKYLEAKINIKTSQRRNSQSEKKETDIPNGSTNNLQLVKNLQTTISKKKSDAFLTLKTLSQQDRSEPKTQKSINSVKISESDITNAKTMKAVQYLKKFQSQIMALPKVSCDQKQTISLLVQISQLKQQLNVSRQKITQLKQQLGAANQRMQMQLLKKSLALMQSQIDSQEKQQVIKQYEIQLKFRQNNNMNVLLFTLEDFQIQRRRLQRINQKLYKEFQNNKETLQAEIKKCQNYIVSLKMDLERTNLALKSKDNELQALRAYKFQNQYQKECLKQKNSNYVCVPFQFQKNNKQFNSAAACLLSYIQNCINKQPMGMSLKESLNPQNLQRMKLIQQRIQTLVSCPNTIKNKYIKLKSLQQSIAVQQNVKVSTQDLNSFLEIFQNRVTENTSIDFRIQQQLESKILSLNQRLLQSRELILAFLRSIQIKNMTKDLLNLIESISDMFQFSDLEKQSFSGGRKSIFQRLFS